MSANERLKFRLRQLGRDERGLAIPTALMALIATFALATVAVMATIDVQRGTARDHDSKEAIAAADSGASIAMMRLNRYLPSLSTVVPCIGPNGLPQTPLEGGWCPKTELAEKVGDAQFTYQVSAYGATKAIDVVAWGTAGSVTRRVNVDLQAIDGKNVFADEKVIGEEGIEFSGASAEVETDLGTNGEITNSGGSSPTLCGNARHGIGKGPTPPLSCGGIEEEGNMILPPVVPPVNIATQNANCRLLEKPVNCIGIDPYIGQGAGKRDATTPWNPQTRVLEIKSKSLLTMGGNPYWVCKVIVDGGKLYMPFNSEVNIYIDTPEHCNMAPGDVQFEVKGNGEVLSTAFNPAQESYAIPGIYLLGSGKVLLSGNPSNVSPETGLTSNEMMIYAPQSTIEFKGASRWKGMIAGKRVVVNGNVRLESSSKFKEPDQHLAPIFQRSRYVECAGGSGATPNANC